MIAISVAKYTELGSRERNEDYFLTGISQSGSFFALADGLGGHGLGDEASKSVCHSAIEYFTNHPEFRNEDFPCVYDVCQSRLLERQKEAHASGKMRTTLNLLYIDDSNAYWSHIGDSRTYYFQNGQLIKRTFDHSVPQMLAAMGDIQESQIRFHEDRNRLLRVLGVDSQTPNCETEVPVPLTGDQQFLLCSDGFWEMITEEQMLLCLEEAEEPQLWVDNMMELVHRNGRNKNTDNTTVMAVWIKGEK